jgi:uncharacterized protein YndB with AHSA1/START domain
MTDATLVTDGGLPGVRLERVLPDPPPVVWRALTAPEELARWFPCGIEVDGGEWKPGAALRFPFPSDVIDMTLTGEILECDAPSRLAYTWGDEVLRFELHEQDGGTRLVLVNELPGDRAARNAAGWEVCLERLRGATEPSRPWRARFDDYVASFSGTLGHQQGPPEGFKGDEAESP